MRTIPEIIKQLEKSYEDSCEDADKHEYEAWKSGMDKESIDFFNVDRVGTYHTVMDVPQVENYEEALSTLRRKDVLMDMGAGDLRFALMASEKCKKVYAVEMNPETISRALGVIGYALPRNLVVICADWRYVPVWRDVTIIINLVNGSPGSRKWFGQGRRVYLGIVSSTIGNKVVRVKNY